MSVAKGGQSAEAHAGQAAHSRDGAAPQRDTHNAKEWSLKFERSSRHVTVRCKTTGKNGLTYLELFIVGRHWLLSRW